MSTILHTPGTDGACTVEEMEKEEGKQCILFGEFQIKGAGDSSNFTLALGYAFVCTVHSL